MLRFLIGESFLLLVVGAIAWLGTWLWQWTLLRSPLINDPIPARSNSDAAQMRLCRLPRWLKLVLLFGGIIGAGSLLLMASNSMMQEAPDTYRFWQVPFCLTASILFLLHSNLRGWRGLVFWGAFLVPATAWFVVPSWLTINIGTTILSLGMLLWCAEWLRKRSVKFVLVIALAIMLYDALSVFGTGQMVAAATQPVAYTTPDLMIAPRSFSWSAKPLSALGFGDILDTSLLVLIGFCLSRQYNQPRFLWGALLGYGLGFVASTVFLVLSRFPQPATIYLFPGIILGLWVAARSARVPWRQVLSSPSLSLTSQITVWQKGFTT